MSNISFQLLLHIKKVKSQEDQQFSRLSFSDVIMVKSGIFYLKLSLISSEVYTTL